jgi:lambda repressor-like predicted transcriptional regulator
MLTNISKSDTILTMVSETTIKIRSMMLRKGLSGAEISRRVGVTRQAINGVINLKWKSRRIRKAIANNLGVKYRNLWDENGTP